MMGIAILILLIIIGVIMVVYGYVEEKDNLLTFGLVICTLVMLGVVLVEEPVAKKTKEANSNFRVKQPITPKIKIECIDNKCDTTYIYNFKEDEQ